MTPVIQYSMPISFKGEKHVVFFVFDFVFDIFCRYFAVVYPIKRRVTKTSPVIIIIFIWICAVLLASPQFVVSRTKPFKHGTQVN